MNINILSSKLNKDKYISKNRILNYTHKYLA